MFFLGRAPRKLNRMNIKNCFRNLIVILNSRVIFSKVLNGEGNWIGIRRIGSRKQVEDGRDRDSTNVREEDTSGNREEEPGVLIKIQKDQVYVVCIAGRTVVSFLLWGRNTLDHDNCRDIKGIVPNVVSSVPSFQQASSIVKVTRTTVTFD